MCDEVRTHIEQDDMSAVSRWAPLLILALLFSVLVMTVHVTIHAQDTGSYIHLAQRISEGRLAGYGFARSPGYPLLILLAGFRYGRLVIFQALLTVVSMAAIHHMAIRELGRRLALLCALLYSLNLTVWSYSFAVLSDSVAVSLTVISLCLMYTYLRRHDPRFLPPAVLVISFGILVRPILLSVLAAFIVACLFDRRCRRHTWLTCLLTLLVLAPWVLTVWKHAGMITLTTLLPVNITNHTGGFLEHADDEFGEMRDAYLAVRDSLGSHEMAIFRAQPRMRAAHPNLSDADYNRMLLRMSLSAMRARPVSYIRSVFRSLVRNHIPANPHEPFLERFWDSDLMFLLSNRIYKSLLIMLMMASYLYWSVGGLGAGRSCRPTDAFPAIVVLFFTIPVALLESPNGRYLMPLYGLFTLFGLKAVKSAAASLRRLRPDRGVIKTLADPDSWPHRLMENSGELHRFLDEFHGTRKALRVFDRNLAWDGTDDFWLTDPVRRLKHPLDSPMFTADTYRKCPRPDPVVLWELSRLSIVPALAGCSAAEHQDASECLSRMLLHWSLQNPFPGGFAWRVPQEAAIRSFSLLPALLWGKGATRTTAEVLLGRCVEQLLGTTLRGTTPKNNHVLVELTSLALMLPLYPRLWKKHGYDTLDRLFTEFKRQFHSDGHHGECSTGYHAVALESLSIFLEAVPRSEQLRDAVQLRMPDMEGLAELAARAKVVVALYSRCFGRSPGFGDSSDSWIFPGYSYYHRVRNDHGYLLGARQRESWEETADSTFLRVFPESGYGYFRNGKYGVCMNGSIPGEASGHSHEDKGSFVLQVRARPVFVDPGTWMYNCPGEKRAYYRSAMNHNVLAVDCLEQSHRDLTSGFTRMGSLRSGINASGERTATLWHDGYSRFEGLGRVSRDMRFEENGILVEERVEGSGVHDLTVTYLMHPEVEWNEVGREVRARSGETLLRMDVPENAEIRCLSARYSRCYGEEEPTTKLVIRFPGSRLPFHCTYRLQVLEDRR